MAAVVGAGVGEGMEEMHPKTNQQHARQDSRLAKQCAAGRGRGGAEEKRYCKSAGCLLPLKLWKIA